MAGNRTVLTKHSDRIMTRHPAGKQGVRIERIKYEAMRRAVLRCVPRSAGGIALAELADRVIDALDASVFGPGVGVTWYLVTVKQDLEARGEIEQVPGVKPQHLRRPRRRAAP
ncbi:MAG: hypothetical protein BroJett001_32700 [Chloroflexota bacterium]|nr:MAG: hypothetical protein BroJett001_32700 [Chloroflexota bacterium]